MNLEGHILHILAGSASRTFSIGDLSRDLGVNPKVVLHAARHLVADGKASPAFAQMHGVATLRGLTARTVRKEPSGLSRDQDD